MIGPGSDKNWNVQDSTKASGYYLCTTTESPKLFMFSSRLLNCSVILKKKMPKTTLKSGQEHTNMMLMLKWVCGGQFVHPNWHFWYRKVEVAPPGHDGALFFLFLNLFFFKK